MNYIVLDLEWNQASDTKEKLENELTFEIIEIGAVKLNSEREQTDDFHQLIKPQVYGTMNCVTGELIHISMDELEDCKSFKEVISDFLHWCGDDYIFCTWGSTDLSEIQKNMDYYGMAPISEQPVKYYDIQKLFSIAFEDRKARRTLQYAVDFLKIEKDAAFHRAYADAFYAAEIFKRIKNPKVLDNYSFDTYRLPKNKSEEIFETFSDHAKYISREFLSKNIAMGDRDVVSTKCFLCGAKTRKKVPWFSNNGKQYYSVMFCPKHGNIRGKIRMRKSKNSLVYVVKTLRLVGPEVVDDIIDKRDHIRENRKERRHRV